MRPPEFTGGNQAAHVLGRAVELGASMRPPEFTGGNAGLHAQPRLAGGGFNEAAGIHRRKHRPIVTVNSPLVTCFNEAAGIHRRKLVSLAHASHSAPLASMRPPEFTGGNPSGPSSKPAPGSCFNEAAGIHRRKLARVHELVHHGIVASMRPPEFTGGNSREY